eukprot:TRINITY_DN2251_c0_g1_i19.p1 TRINITY_DN2251_c0_g1~~TRINITY_DN2251_c0_g1_i19.p1  ORF type:complete len:474 (+),score=39.54 TRINITY_DN2251_c0_g1_i19:100-1422(+)
MILKLFLIFLLSIGAHAQGFNFPSRCKVRRTFEAANGILKYPEGDGNYANHDHACFFFSCPAGKRSTLTWRAFDIAGSETIISVSPVKGDDNARYSEILRTGDDSDSLPPDSSFYEGGTLLSFISRDHETAKGFEVEWGCQEPPSCPFEFNFPTSCLTTSTLNIPIGRVTHPERGFYSNSESACFFFCCPGKRLTLEWLYTRIETGWDFITVFPVKGNTALPNHVLRHTGFSRPANTVVDMDGVLLHFTSDDKVTNQGFRLDWTCEEIEGQPLDNFVTPEDSSSTFPAGEPFTMTPVIGEPIAEEGPVNHDEFNFPQKCKTGTILDGQTGTLNYPNGGGNYSNSEVVCFFFSCPGMDATLTWRSFDTERYFDHVLAFPVSSSTAGTTPVLPPHSGNSLPLNTVVEQDGILLVFKSDRTITSKGFELEWMCSGGDEPRDSL